MRHQMKARHNKKRNMRAEVLEDIVTTLNVLYFTAGKKVHQTGCSQATEQILEIPPGEHEMNISQVHNTT